MLIREYGVILFECDNGCGAVLKTDTADFYVAKAKMERAGWRTIRKDASGHFLHSCTECG